ncbi:hypothetical protein GPJ56_000469 [Histomonas meleagridis]|uniref:uncharacterized protein n=1 Tax=Histomonas meleagridis TaxID=135588 RepID=UPI003559AE46|nr:hypothetical protein GPJ56_000469 [Histomonas meleagridis]KAH0796492.1 hypothetical protein GO595_010385 [Histomonas meleagridis]
MPNYILDFVIEYAKFIAPPNIPIQYVWLKFKADGVNQTVCTSQIRPSEYMEWHKNVRLIISLDKLEGYHLAACFYLLPYNQIEAQIFAVAQVRLSELPIGNPRRLSFPLMSSLDMSAVAIQVTIIATISEIRLDPQPQILQPQIPQNILPPFQQQFFFNQYANANNFGMPQQQIPAPLPPLIQNPTENQTKPASQSHKNQAHTKRPTTRRFGNFPKK